MLLAKLVIHQLSGATEPELADVAELGPDTVHTKLTLDHRGGFGAHGHGGCSRPGTGAICRFVKRSSITPCKVVAKLNDYYDYYD